MMAAVPYDDHTEAPEEPVSPAEPELYDGTASVYDGDLVDDDELYDMAEAELYEDAAELFEASFEDALEAFEQEDVEEYVATVEDEAMAIEYELDDDSFEYPSIRVKVHEMQDGLFGFTDLSEPSSQASVHVNSNVYDIDFEGTPEHEKTHRMHQGKDELTIRYINGDLDPENTLTMAHRGGRKWSYDPIEDADY